MTTSPMSMLRNEKGSIIAVAMIMLALLTLIGIVSTNTSTTEIQIATNNQNYQVEFFLADSGWRQGAIWLENRGAPPIWTNTADNIVKNFGSGTAPDIDTSNLKSLTPDNSSLSAYSIPFWYNVEHLDPGIIQGGSDLVAGNEKGYERFFYAVNSNANDTQEVQVRLSKIFKVGY